jgi:hypothetical protein
MLSWEYLFAGLLVGLFVVSVFNPVPSKHILQPDIDRPEQVLGHPTVENSCFQSIAYEVPCPATHDSLSLLSS